MQQNNTTNNMTHRMGYHDAMTINFLMNLKLLVGIVVVIKGKITNFYIKSKIFTLVCGEIAAAKVP